MDLERLSFGRRIRYRWFNFRKWLFCPLFSKLNWVWGYKKWDCKRYEPKIEYVWVWMCPTCRGRLPKEVVGAIYQKFEPGKEPLEPCSCTLPVPVEKVIRDVCVRSGKLPGKFCINIEKRNFEKGTEPITKCGIHNYKKSGRREEMCGGVLGFFMSFLRHAWKPENQIAAEEDAMEVLAEEAKRDIKYNDFFMWMCDNKREHSPVNDKTPYKQFKTILGKRKFDLDKWDDRYWELFDRFIYMHSLFDIIPVPQMIMAGGYCDYPFKSNVNGINTKAVTQEALPYEWALGDKTVDIIKKYFQAFLLKFVNEPRHGGRDDAYHRIADWHRDMFWGFFVDHFPTKEKALASLVIDQSISEAGQGHLAWHHGGAAGQFCPKCKKYRWSSAQWMDRLRIGEQHGISIVDGFYEKHKDLTGFFRSGNDRSRWHEDGGAVSCSKAHGYKPYWVKLCYADAEEYGVMCDHAWAMQKERGKGKKTVYICIFPCETLNLVDGIFYVTYTKKTVNWSRFDAMLTAHIKHFG